MKQFCLSLFGNHGKDYIQERSKTELRDLASRSFPAQRYYELAFSILYAIHTSNKESGASPHWCQCGNCQNMESEKEEICCEQPDCLTTTHPYQQWREIHLDYSILTVALKSNLVHKAKFYRQEAYRQFSYWKHGHKGKGKRIPLPSCVVWNIRNCYPDLDGKYEGFERH